MAKRVTSSYSWNADIAYAVGLFAADGNLSPDGRHLEFTSKDLVLVELIKRILKLANRIAQKPNGQGMLYWRIQFGNVTLYRWLQEQGLHPNKSKTLGPIQVPDAFFFDYLRGFLDGDGSVRVYQDPHYPASQRIYLMFYSASLVHLKWLQASTLRLAGVTGYTDSPGRVFRLTYAKADTRVLWKHMYYDKNVPCLIRKYAIMPAVDSVVPKW